jgi:hypothetical protein
MLRFAVLSSLRISAGTSAEAAPPRKPRKLERYGSSEKSTSLPTELPPIKAPDHAIIATCAAADSLILSPSRAESAPNAGKSCSMKSNVFAATHRNQ